MSKPTGGIAYNIYTAVMATLGVLDVIFYISIWIKISRITKSLSSATSGDETFKMEAGKMVNVQDQKSYANTAKVKSIMPHYGLFSMLSPY